MKFEPMSFNPENPWYIGATPLSHLLLNFDQTYRGRCILVPKTEAEDLESLPEVDIGPLTVEVARIGRTIKSEFEAARMNYASLGNVVGQLHWHIVPRYVGDANWGGPPWPVSLPIEPSVSERKETIERIRRHLDW